MTPKLSLEMAQKVIVPQKKNYVPQFLKQRDINSYYVPMPYIMHLHIKVLSGKMAEMRLIRQVVIKERGKIR